MRLYFWRRAKLAVRTLCFGAAIIGVARADQVQTTYLCVTASGSKALQDHPCEGAAASKEIPTTHHEPSMPESWSRQMQAAVESGKRANCKNARKALADGEYNNRVVINKPLGTVNAQNNQQRREWIASECAAYGR